MKKFAFIFAAIAASIVVSCTKETPAETPYTSAPAGMKMVSITASVDDTATKTTYTPDGTDPTLLKFSWTKGDQISVLCSDNNFYSFTAEQTGASSTFTGMLPFDVELGVYALYPASPVHYYDASAWQPYFGIDMYKDLSESFSADLPMTAKKGEDETYSFKHATSALLFTFTNIPDGIETVEISFENESMQFSGRHKAYYGEPWSLTFLETGNADEDRRFVRKVSVEDNIAEVYLPFKGTLWGGYDNTINIVGYDADEKEHVLLKDQLMPGKDLALKTVGQVVPVASLALPDYIDFSKVDWDNAAVSEISDNDRFKALNVIADSKYLYIRLNPVNQTPFGANYLDVSFCDGNGTNQVWWGWTTTGTNTYWEEHKGTVDETGALTSMQYSYNGAYQNILCKSEVVDGEINWYLAYPIEYLDTYRSTEGKIYVSSILWNEYTDYWAIPVRGTSMLEVTLP